MKLMRTLLTVLGVLTAGTLAMAPAATAQDFPAAPALPQVPSVEDVQGMVDDAVSGALDQLPQVPGVPTPAPAPAPEPEPAPRPAPTGCAAEATACINLSNQTAWLQNGGVITRGPVPISSGRAGYETPAGYTRVTRKIIDEWSTPYNAPMPYAVYFSAGTAYPNDIGIAFHEGDPGVLSHGCIHLLHDDAVAFFSTLQVGDVVDVVY